jgi:hypothetical protein
MEKIIDLDAPFHPGTVPDLGLGDLLRYAPILEEVIAAILQASHQTGTFTPPPIKFRLAGKHFTIEEKITVGP